MASWNDVLKSIQEAEEGKRLLSPADNARAKAVKNLSDYRNRNVICYYSGWLQGSQASEIAITDDDMNGLMNAVYKMDRSKGLDLVLHTPGGDLAATEAIVKYLKDCFGRDICAFIPQMAMSGGTMIACSCKEIWMGRQSSLGPTDPQFRGVPAGGVLDEFARAVDEVEANPSSAVLWGQIIGKYHPTFLGDCQNAVEMSKQIVGDWLQQNMFHDDDHREDKTDKVISLLCDHKKSAMHNRHFSHTDLENIGLNVKMLEKDDKLQDLVLTLHHTFMVTFQRSNIIKIIEGSNERRWMISETPSS